MADKMSKLVLPIKNVTTGEVIDKEFDVGGGGNTFVGTSAEWEALTSEQQNAYDCRVLTDDDLDTKNVIDNLTSDSATDALSAKQGKVLAQLVAPVLSALVAPTGGLVSGDRFVYNGLLYKATATIAEGSTITIDGNCELADCVTKNLITYPDYNNLLARINTQGASYTAVQKCWVLGSIESSGVNNTQVRINDSIVGQTVGGTTQASAVYVSLNVGDVLTTRESYGVYNLYVYAAL